MTAALVLVAAGAGWGAGWLYSGSGANVSSGDRKAIETVVRDYLLENPEVIPEAMDALQRKENAKQLAGISDEVHAPFPGAVLGNPNGSVTLVEFSDFACGYCRKSVADIEALIASNSDLRIVIRELPILSEQSVQAARMALAAAEQGKYLQFHKAMFAAGQPGPKTIETAARRAGLDMGKARATANSPRVQQELDTNLAIARQLGFNGTPSWVAGDQLIAGAVGSDELAEAIKDIRGG
ncbi:MAG: DsbA family protein [Novosphingobium sp.]|nr:DsbA family protein [Novosphingobium sp.]